MVIHEIVNLEPKLTPIYISLFGVNKTEEIKEKIFFQMANISTQPIQLAIKGATACVNGLVEKVTGIDVNINGDIAYKYAHFKLSKDEVLIFDDVERINIDICELLGFVNEFVEQKQMKVIIVANEKEINISRNNHNNEFKYLV